MQTGKVEKEEDGGKGMNDKGSSLSKQDLEKIIVNYDNSIKKYEQCYSQQEGCSHELFQSNPELGEHSLENDLSPYVKQVFYEYDQTLSGHEATLQTIDKTLADFNEALSYLVNVTEQKELEQYIEEWKKCLEDLMDSAKQSADSLEEMLQNISKETQA